MAEVNSNNFEVEVIRSNIPVLVDLWAEWCGPCRLFGPIVDALSEEYKDKVKFVKVNVDKNEPVASRFNVMSIPTTLLIIKGQLKASNVGVMSKESLKKWLDNNI